MNLIDPSLQRYRDVRRTFEKLPADRDGTRLSLEPMALPGNSAQIGSGSRTDQDPNTVDILHLSSDQTKAGSRSETFIELPALRGFFGGKKGNERLVHLSRQVQYGAGGYSLTNVALRTVDLVTGERLSESLGDQAVREAQKLEDRIPFRLYHIDPTGLERQEAGW